MPQTPGAGPLGPLGPLARVLLDERRALEAGTHEPAQDDFGNQYLARVPEPGNVVALGPDSIEINLKAVLYQLGLDPTNQHFANTPARLAKTLRAYVQPTDLEEVLSGGFDDDDLGEEVKKTLVVQTAIPFMGLCAHHLLPFFGSAAVGYLPRGRVVGLSKLTRLVYAAGHLAPTTQEHITNVVADTLFKSSAIQPRGVAVLTSALHGCMSIRGVESPSTRTIASAIRGEFQDYPALENKFMTLAMEGLK